MLYFLKGHGSTPDLGPIPGLTFTESRDADLLSQLCELPSGEVTSRLRDHHRAFVAWYDGVPAAFGWVATQTARVGELNLAIQLHRRHAYLWNFRTCSEYRGLGIYPRLLQFITRESSRVADYFWILHAPENRASEKGIRKAGFVLAGKVSLAEGTAFFRPLGKGAPPVENWVTALGFKQSDQDLAACWNCSSPYLAHKRTTCCCQDRSEVCTGSLYAEPDYRSLQEVTPL